MSSESESALQHIIYLKCIVNRVRFACTSWVCSLAFRKWHDFSYCMLPYFFCLLNHCPTTGGSKVILTCRGPADLSNLRSCCLLLPVVWFNQALHHMSHLKNECVSKSWEVEIECGRVPCLFVFLSRVLRRDQRTLFGLNYPNLVSLSSWVGNLNQDLLSLETLCLSFTF